MQEKLLNDVENYYSKKLAKYGETAEGVDWNGISSQTLRFEQLSKIINTGEKFSINDVGCGYGALVDFLFTRKFQFSYTGIDISKDMILAAQNRFQNQVDVRFLIGTEPDTESDYSTASGIFNIKLNQSNKDWEKHIIFTLDILNRTSRYGFSFNCLTSYSDDDKMKNNLYYANPSKLFDFCKKNYSKQVALLHDYGLYEFTILVRK